MAKKSGDDVHEVQDVRACAHHLLPSPPSVTGSGGSDELVFAVHDYDVGADSENDAGPLYRSIGWDLDNTCTGEGQGSSCVEPPWADGGHTDGVQGIDNVYGQIWWSVKFPPQTTTAATPVLMVRVRGYSDQADDDQVEVSLYVGLGLVPREDGGREDGGSDLRWDGNDRWNVLAEMLASPADGGVPSVDNPRFRDDHAYVSGGMLVAQFREALWTPGASYAPHALVPVHHLILAGSLVHVGQGWELQNLVAGMRVALNDALTWVAQLPNLGSGNPTCQSQDAYSNAKRNICPFVDIASDPGPASAPCDAISAGVLFQAKQAGFAPVPLPPSPASPLVCAGNINPKIDTCAGSADN
jgi:hypothetical protein